MCRKAYSNRRKMRIYFPASIFLLYSAAILEVAFSNSIGELCVNYVGQREYNSAFSSNEIFASGLSVQLFVQDLCPFTHAIKI